MLREEQVACGLPCEVLVSPAGRTGSLQPQVGAPAPWSQHTAESALGALGQRTCSHLGFDLHSRPGRKCPLALSPELVVMAPQPRGPPPCPASAYSSARARPPGAAIPGGTWGRTRTHGRSFPRLTVRVKAAVAWASAGSVSTAGRPRVALLRPSPARPVLSAPGQGLPRSGSSPPGLAGGSGLLVGQGLLRSARVSGWDAGSWSGTVSQGPAPHCPGERVGRGLLVGLRPVRLLSTVRTPPLPLEAWLTQSPQDSETWGPLGVAAPPALPCQIFRQILSMPWAQISTWVCSQASRRRPQPAGGL